MSDSVFPLVLFALASTLSPGGANMLATASGAQFGFRRSVPLLTGIALGLACLAAASAAGLGSLLLAAPSLQLAMKLTGSAYLLWLAWKIGRSGPPALKSDLAQPTRFWGGAGLLMLNPKGWAMALGAAASFALLLGGIFGLAEILSLSLWCVAGLVLARWLTRTWHWRLVNGILGLLLAVSIVPMWLEA